MTRSTSRRSRYLILPLLGAALWAGACPVLRASDVFSATVVSSSPTNVSLPLTESNNHLIPLVEDIGGTSGDLFSMFKGHEFSGFVTKAGVPFLNFTIDLRNVNGAGDKAFLTLPDGRRLTTLTSNTVSDLQHNVETYFKGNATTITANTSNTPIEIADGNPNSATASATNATFLAYTANDVNHLPPSGESFVNPLTVDASAFQTSSDNGAHFSGYRIDVPFGVSYHLPHVADGRVSIALTGAFTYVNFNNTNTYEGSLNLGFPLEIIRRHRLAETTGKEGKDGKTTASAPAWTRLAWTVTPNGGAVASGSVALVEGGITYLGGLCSALSYDFNDRVTLTLADAFTVAEGGSLDVGEYHLADDTDQVIFKNGFVLSYHLTSPYDAEGRLSDRWFDVQAEAYATDFANSAAIPAYASVAVQTVYSQQVGRAGRALLVTRLGFITEQAPDYHSYGGRVSVGLSF